MALISAPLTDSEFDHIVFADVQMMEVGVSAHLATLAESIGPDEEIAAALATRFTAAGYSEPVGGFFS